MLQSELQQEIKLFELLQDFRPVGPARHFYLAGILHESAASGSPVHRDAVWNFLAKLYNLKELNNLHYIQLVIKF